MTRYFQGGGEGGGGVPTKRGETEEKDTPNRQGGSIGCRVLTCGAQGDAVAEEVLERVVHVDLEVERAQHDQLALCYAVPDPHVFLQKEKGRRKGGKKPSVSGPRIDSTCEIMY